MVESSQAPTSVVIYHAEDEPLAVNWIPEVINLRFYQIYNQYRRENRNHNNGQINRNGELIYNLKLKNLSITIAVEYHILDHQTLESLIKCKEKLTKDNKKVIFIIDLMNAAGGNLKNVGEELISQLIEEKYADSIYILSAFINGIPEHIAKNLKKGNILAKPVDANEIATILVNSIMSCA